MASESARRQVTTLRTIISAILIGAAGIGLLYVTSEASPFRWTYVSIQSLLRELGSVLFSAVALYVLWELAAKRAFLAELRSEDGVPRSIEKAGIIGVEESFGRDLRWHESLSECKQLDVFASYASTWRNNNREDLSALATRKGATIRVFLPDPANEVVVSELSNRFGMTKDDVVKHIHDAAEDFKNIFAGKKAKMSLWYVATAPVYSFYRFDKHAYISMYKHRRGRDYVPPTIIISNRGFMWRFLQKETDAIVSNPLGRRSDA